MVTQTTKLSNGLTIITDATSHVETAALGLWVGTGARHETTELNGISHFLEHMMFKGTTTASALEIAEKIEQVGGYMNAYTTRETTAYYTRVLSPHVDTTLDVLTDILQFSTFPEDELQKERKVILQEISETLDNPDDYVFDLFQETAYPHQALGRYILGTASTVQGLLRQDLITYRNKHYSATNMVLAAAGKIDHDALVAMADKNFRHLSTADTIAYEPAHYNGGRSLQYKDLEQVHMILGFQAPALNHQDYYTCAVLSTLLGGGMSSRLFQKVREDLGLAYSIYTFHSAFMDTGLLGIYAGTSSDDVAKMLPVLRHEIFNLESTLSTVEIERAKIQLKSQLLMGLESTATRCEQLAYHKLIFDKSLSIPELIHNIDTVNSSHVQALASSMFAMPLTLTTFGPFKNEKLIHDFHI